MVQVFRQLPKAISVPFGPRAPPTARESTAQANDSQLHDTVVTIIRDAVVCHPSLQA